MKLFVTPRAPNPRRVQMFIAEKGDSLPPIHLETVDLAREQHRTAGFMAMNPFARVPVLKLEDGRALSETRAICTYLEGLGPNPWLMGATPTDRAFIEMADRRMEHYLLTPLANWVRHCHPGLAPLEQPQFPDYGRAQAARMRETARWLDGELARQPWVAGRDFSIADITAFCGLEFARGLMKYRPGEEGLKHLQAWRDRMAERPSAAAGA